MRASLLAVSDESPELHREHAPKDSHRARGVKTPWNLAEALFAAGISGAAGGVLTGLAAVSILIYKLASVRHCASAWRPP